eukprot:1480985-Pyramimonas_sp.AAC.1
MLRLYLLEAQVGPYGDEVLDYVLMGRHGRPVHATFDLVGDAIDLRDVWAERIRDVLSVVIISH